MQYNTLQNVSRATNLRYSVQTAAPKQMARSVAPRSASANIAPSRSRSTRAPAGVLQFQMSMSVMSCTVSVCTLRMLSTLGRSADIQRPQQRPPHSEMICARAVKALTGCVVAAPNRHEAQHACCCCEWLPWTYTHCTLQQVSSHGIDSNAACLLQFATVLGRGQQLYLRLRAGAWRQSQSLTPGRHPQPL
jgi:hypothetical protein